MAPWASPSLALTDRKRRKGRPGRRVNTAELTKTPLSTSVAVSKLRVYAVLILFIALKATGNLSLAWGMKHLTHPATTNPIDYVLAMLSPFVGLGVVLLIVSLLTRMALLSYADLTFVLPVTAIGYVIATFLGRFFLHEPVSAARWAGTLLIFGGAALVGSTPHATVVPAETANAEVSVK